MAQAIAGLEPAHFWKHFAEISRIPRGSKNEKAAAAYVMKVARRLELAAKQDRTGNVLVTLPASSGHERAPMVCLQAHLDMVCEKRPETRHDFTRDPLTLVRDGNYLHADGTTLGADNGVGVASCLAIMEDRAVEHGPLELLFTVDEETGLTGASNLEPGFLQSRILINLDSEDEGILYVGCAGGLDTTGTWTLERDDAPSGWTALEVRVGGLRGGHSGTDIHTGRGNAVKILNRALLRLGELGARLARVDAGSKRNALPRDGSALLLVPKGRLEEARAAVAELHDTVRSEFGAVEPDLRVTAEPAKARVAKVFKRGLQRRLTQVLAALPHGVIKMSAEIPGLVETSTNLAVVKTGPRTVTVNTSQRSSVASEIAEIGAGVRAALELAGAEVSGSDGYAGWKPNLDSAVLKTSIDVHRRLFGAEPKVEAVHAGLECGIIGDKYPGMDMVSFGPTVEGAHSPDERIQIDTVERYWRYLLEVLKAIR